jgi:hypothetical protein
MNRYYSNEVDSDETLPLLNGMHISIGSESEVGIVVGSCVGHSLPHSIIRGDNYV